MGRDLGGALLGHGPWCLEGSTSFCPQQAALCSFLPYPGDCGRGPRALRNQVTGREVRDPRGTGCGPVTKAHGTPESWLSHCHCVSRGGLTPEKAKLQGTHGPSSWGIGFPRKSRAGRDTSCENKPRADSAAECQPRVGFSSSVRGIQETSRHTRDRALAAQWPWCD